MKKKRGKASKIFLSIVLILLAAACLGGIVFMALSLKERQQEEQALRYAEQLEKEQEELRAAEEAEKTETLEETAVPEETVSEAAEEPAIQEDGVITVGEQTFLHGFEAISDENTIPVGDTDVLSAHALLIDLSSDHVTASKGTDGRIYPASMTKILTILVAAEHIENMDDTFTMTPEIVNYSLSNGCSAAGFVPDEVIPVKDLFYGTILPSGGEAAVGLATYTAGSQEAFVELMNEKLADLGLSDTAHFTNCVGIFDENHYCTMKDMAMILKAAVENDFCREVLKEHVYYTTATPQNPEGIILSNWFLRKIEDKDSGGTVLCAKTGFVNESGFCAASYFISESGRPYICVTADTYNDWRCIYDHVAMYKLYTE